MTIKGLLFDKDGTLFDFESTWGGWTVGLIDDLAHGDRDLSTKLASAIGYDLGARAFHSDSPVIAGTPEEIAAHLIGHLPGFSAPSLISHMNLMAAEAPQVEATPLIPLLQGLRQRSLKLGVATNDAEGPARAHLHSAGIDQCFDFISGFDSGYGSKPHPGPCFAFAEAVHLRPGEIAMVGDSRHDLLAGRAAGMTTVAVLSGLAQAEDLQSLADIVLPTVADIPGWLDQVDIPAPTTA